MYSTVCKSSAAGASQKKEPSGIKQNRRRWFDLSNDLGDVFHKINPMMKMATTKPWTHAPRIRKRIMDDATIRAVHGWIMRSERTGIYA